MKLNTFFTSQVFTDEEGRKIHSRLLGTFLITAMAAFLLLIIFRFFVDYSLSLTDGALFLLSLLFVYLYYLLKRGSLKRVSVIFISVTWIGLTFIAARSAGIKDVSVSGYVLLIFLATLFNGFRLAVIVTVFSIISIWVMAIAEYKGILIPFKDPVLIFARDFTFFYILLIFAIVLFERSFRYSYNRIKKELHERTIAEQNLSKNEAKLLESNEALMKAKDKAEESDRLKTAFLQNISHEIRTPMNGIIGFSELIKEEQVPARRNEYIQSLSSCTYQLATLVNDLIDISKIEAGDISFNTEVFSAEDIIGFCLGSFSGAAHEKGLGLFFNNSVKNTSIRSDREKLKRILSNLISNAIKFTEKGSVNVSFEREGGFLLMSVHDTGIGIDRAITEIIFDRFRQAEMGLTRTFGGTGLGLAIVKGLAQFLKGSVSVDSAPGAGSVFTVRVPVEFVEKEPEKHPDENDLCSRKDLKILIAEDDEFSVLFYKEIFKNEKCRLYFAETGEKAVSLFSAERDFDVVLMDIKMPGINGYEAAAQIRIADKSVPVIAVTAFAFEDEKKKALGLGFNDYIVKPVEKKILIESIRKALYMHIQ